MSDQDHDMSDQDRMIHRERLKKPSLRDAQVLIVEDDDGLRELLQDEVVDAGYDATGVASAEAALSILEQRLPDVVVSDLRLPGGDGMELLAHTRELASPPAFIVITAFGSIAEAVDALKKGADDFLTKPLNLDHFMISVSRSVKMRRLRREVQRFRSLLGSEDFYGLLGRSNVMRTLTDQIVHISRANGPVLIVGESGVGKELVAHALHEESSRADGPFLAVNCAGIPGQLLESEFFGYRKGAFTGAVAHRKGLFEQADGGTILLDEIAEMPVDLQAKLLRVLEEGRIRPVGSRGDKPVDVRVVAATNRDLETRQREGQFRRDLYYRLETFQISVPPLRKRGDDVDLLAAHFLGEFSRQMNKDIRGFSHAAIEALRMYDFPGNVRELKNAVERAVAFCQAGDVDISHFPHRIQEASRRRTVPGAGIASGVLLKPDEHLPPLEEIERRYIQHVLTTAGGNKRRAAQILDIGRRTLYRKLDVDESSFA